MKETNNKILIGSLSKYLDSKIILGDKVKPETILLYSTLLKSYEYALSQLENGNARYNSVVQELSMKIDTLKYQCPDICLYKNKMVVYQPNTAPRIRGMRNLIGQAEQLIDLQKSSMFSYSDLENNAISEIVFTSKNENIDIYYKGELIELNKPYAPDFSDIKIYYNVDENNKYFYKNSETNTSCVSTILELSGSNLEDYNRYILEGFSVIGYTSNTIRLQKINEGVIESRTVSVNSFNAFESSFGLKVKDNHLHNPLYSNITTVSPSFNVLCEPLQCNSETYWRVVAPHESEYTFTNEDLGLQPGEQIVLNGHDGPFTSYLSYKGVPINEITVSTDNFVIKYGEAQYLKHIAPSDAYVSSSATLSFVRGLIKGINYCPLEILQVTKAESLERPVTIDGDNIVGTLDTPSSTFNGVLDITINYTGQGTYVTSWQQISGPTNSTIILQPSNDLSIEGLTEGVYTYRVTVTTSISNYVTTKDITATIGIANQVPVVTAGPDQTNTVLDINSEVVNLTATESDYENNIVSRQWTQISGPNTATITNSSSLNTTVTNMIQGNYVFRITVTDGGGLSSSDDIQINMVQENRPPVIQPLSNVTVTLIYNSNTGNTSIGYDFNPTITDPDGDTFTRNWTQISGPATAAIFQSSDSFSFPVAGDYVLRLTATDEHGLSSFEEVTVTVNPAVNTPPTVDDSVVSLPSVSNGEINYTLTVAEFTNNFQDAENHTYKKTTITQLPSQGELSFNSTPIAANFEFQLSQVGSLTYKIDNIKAESDGNFVYTEDIDARIQQLTTDGYVQQSYSNGVYVFNKLSENLIGSGVDGTFDTLTGNNNQFNGVVSGAGWSNGFGTADIVSPNPTDDGSATSPLRPGVGCPASPQGGNYAGAISSGDTGGEEFVTSIATTAGETYRITFYQTFAGDNVQVYPLNTLIPWKVTLGSQTLLSTPNPWLGFQNQVWTEETLEFTATTTSATTPLKFQAGIPNGGAAGVRHGYLGIDDIKIQTVSTSVTDTVTLTGTQLANQTIKFKTSDNGAGELYSNEQTLTLTV